MLREKEVYSGERFVEGDRVYRERFVLTDNRFVVQLFEQMLEVQSYYTVAPVFGIGSTGREWRFFRLPMVSQGQGSLRTAVAEGSDEGPEDATSVSTPRKEREDEGRWERKQSSPLSTNVGPCDVQQKFFPVKGKIVPKTVNWTMEAIKVF